jgi:hypothetical protein
MRGMIARSAGVGLVLATVSVTLTAGPAKKPASPVSSGTPVVTDWSHRHLIFSHPTTPEQTARVQRDVRYAMQQDRAKSRTILETDVRGAKKKFGPHHRRGLRMHRDWKVDLGPGAAVPAGKYPAKFNFSNIVAYCYGDPTVQADFVVFGTGVAGAANQGSIVAFTNLYAGCPGPQRPAAYFSYNTGGTVNTSPVLSLDGTQLAFTQVSGGTSSLVLLKWSPFDGPNVQTPITPNIVVPGAYFGCTAPCMTSFTLGANDTNSSVYYDYGADTAYVGDDSGKLHQFTALFKGPGQPAEFTTGWPVAISGNRLTGAVHEPASGNTFVGDSGGFLYRVDAGGVKTASGQLDSGTGLAEGPIIDSTIATAYVFSSKNSGGFAAVIQMSTGFGAGSTGTQATIGTGATAPTIQYNGAFDNGYIFSPDSTGNLWVCGNPGSNPTLYQVPIIAGVMGTPKAGPPLSTTTQTTCSPVTDVYNTILQGAGLPQEWTFLSVQAAGVPTPCATHSCVMSFKVTPWRAGATYNVGQEVLDSNFNIQVEEVPNAVSGATTPPWNPTVFGTTTDGTAHWRNQGRLTAQTPVSWTQGTLFPQATTIVDSNNNIEIAETLGTSGTTQPAWSLIEGTEIVDGGVTWYNIGANPVAALQAPGGTSGIIIDNTTNNPGGSQVYYSTLDGGCGGDGTHGCGVQASQQGLN